MEIVDVGLIETAIGVQKCDTCIPRGRQGRHRQREPAKRRGKSRSDPPHTTPMSTYVLS